MPITPKKRADGQMTGLAAEFFVAAELLKRGLQTSLTLGNAKAIDLLAHDPESGTTHVIQVKGLRYGPNYFPIDPAKIHPNHVYVFVTLNEPGVAVEFSIVPGKLLRVDEQLNQPSKFPGIYSRSLLLLSHKDKWELFRHTADTDLVG